jgi:hypothetical protein
MECTAEDARMDITPEERQQIREEEKERREFRVKRGAEERERFRARWFLFAEAAGMPDPSGMPRSIKRASLIVVAMAAVAGLLIYWDGYGFVAVVGFAFEAWVLWKILTGRSWAKTLFLVLSLATVPVGVWLFAMDRVEGVMSFISITIRGIACLDLYRAESYAWFGSAPKAPPCPPADTDTTG